MKKLLLTAGVSFLFVGQIFAQFSASQIWGLNNRVDPIPHNSINAQALDLAITYNSTGVPLTLTSTTQLTGIPMPMVRITSTVNGNAVVCISSTQPSGDTTWKNDERTTFTSNGTIDTSIIIELANNNGPFEFKQKNIYQPGTDANQHAYHTYSWVVDKWELRGKSFYYLNNGRVDSVVNYRIVNGTDSSRNAFTYYYYSMGLDSSLESILQTATNEFDIRNKMIVEQKENGKTKQFALYAKNTTVFTKNGTFIYNNVPATSVKENVFNNVFSIYPNPSSSMLNITLSEGIKATLTISDIRGKVVSTESTNQQSTQLNVAHLNNGIYFITITSDNGTSTQKFIKQ